MTFEQVESKLDLLRANLEQLDAIPHASYAEFSGDARNVAATLYPLQTSVQALIDVGGYLVARRGLATPRTSYDVFERLEQAGLVPIGTAAEVGPMIGFRNRVVHLYDRVDAQRVYEVLTVHRTDIPRILALLLAIPDD
jgi:uncharacterized protein YutE (UPF0331/DUF86 family)